MYQKKGEKLVEINNILKDVSNKTKLLREQKKLLQDELIEYYETTNAEPIVVGGQKLIFTKKEKKKGINKEVIENSLKGVSGGENILNRIENNRETYVDKKISIK